MRLTPFFSFVGLLALLFLENAAAKTADDIRLASKLLDEQKWQQAHTVLQPLYQRNPNNNRIKNLYAVSLFYLGDNITSQKLLTEVIESYSDSKVAYRNLEKLFSYAAANIYNQALRLSSPVLKPQMLLDKNFSMTNGNGKNNKPKISATKEKTKHWQDQLNQKKTSNQNSVSQQQKKTEEIPANNKINIVSETINKRLELWLKAWQMGNIDAYISAYSIEFHPPKKSRKNWIEDRYAKVRPAKKIQVEILELKHRQISNNKMQTEFIQIYRSNSYQDKVRKKLQWRLENQQWVIVKEVVTAIL